jgi:hypothetical protein
MNSTRYSVRWKTTLRGLMLHRTITSASINRSNAHSYTGGLAPPLKRPMFSWTASTRVRARRSHQRVRGVLRDRHRYGYECRDDQLGVRGFLCDQARWQTHHFGAQPDLQLRGTSGGTSKCCSELSEGTTVKLYLRRRTGDASAIFTQKEEVAVPEGDTIETIRC